MTDRTRLAVLGSPISHSRSPAIHRAAYRVLGADWSYGAEEIDGESLPDFIASRDETWRGLSLTMPLKRDVLPLLTGTDPVAHLVGAANTVLLTEAGPLGFNTDVGGLAAAFGDAGVHALGQVWILGGGATAASAVAAMVELGSPRCLVFARDPLRAGHLIELGTRCGVEVTVESLDRISEAQHPDAVISTLPSSAPEVPITVEVRSRAILFDVAYDPWPSRLATQWNEVGGTVIPGHDLLVRQALAQIRIFASGSADIALPREDDVLSAMRAAVWKD